VTDEEKEAAANARYQAAMHAVQSGIALHMNYDRKFCNPKHLRVGVNSALVDDEAMADLLIAKGVFTRLEYLEALAAAAEREVERWTATVRDDLGAEDGTAYYALRSYQYSNSSTELAEEIADALFAEITKAGGKVPVVK
jgi:hypothetical protein